MRRLGLRLPVEDGVTGGEFVERVVDDLAFVHSQPFGQTFHGLARDSRRALRNRSSEKRLNPMWKDRQSSRVFRVLAYCCTRQSTPAI